MEFDEKKKSWYPSSNAINKKKILNRFIKFISTLKTLFDYLFNRLTKVQASSLTIILSDGH